MVSSVASVPYYSYLNQLQGVGDSAATPAVSTSSGSGASSVAATNAQSLVSSLLGNSNGFAPEVLSLLQENGSGSFDPIASLLNGPSTNNALTNVYANLYDAASAATLTTAQDNAAPSATGGASSGSGASAPPANPVQSLINEQTQASIAYNQTLVQNSATAVKSIIQA